MQTNLNFHMDMNCPECNETIEVRFTTKEWKYGTIFEVKSLNGDFHLEDTSIKKHYEDCEAICDKCNNKYTFKAQINTYPITLNRLNKEI